MAGKLNRGKKMTCLGSGKLQSPPSYDSNYLTDVSHLDMT